MGWNSLLLTHVQRQHACRPVTSMAMLLQFVPHVIAVVKLVDVLSRRADVWFAWLLLSLVMIKKC